MWLVILLVVLLLAFGGGGYSYPTWGAAYPAWGGNLLYALAFIVLVVLLIHLFMGRAP